MIPTYKKGRKEDPGSYRPASLTSVPGTVMEQIIRGAIPWHVQDSQGIRPRAQVCKRQVLLDKPHCLLRQDDPPSG